MSFPEENSSGARKNDSTAEDLLGSVRSEEKENKPDSPLLRSSIGISRYGRAIKPKSPNTVVHDSPKNLKMPKNFKDEIDNKEENLKMGDNCNASLNISQDVSMEEKVEKVNYEDLKASCQWTLGQLVWARIGSYPFWPSIVTNNPDTETYVLLKKGKTGKHTYKQVHVRFCADKGRHNWVSASNIIAFQGLSDFEERAKQITPEIKKKEPKYAAAFIIKQSIKLKWDDAVAEACRLMNKAVEKRIEFFNPEIKKKKSPNKSLTFEKSEDNIKKRKITEDENLNEKTDDIIKKRKSTVNENSTLKKLKVNTEGVKEMKENVEKIKLENDLNIETPPTPPSSHQDSSDEAPIKKINKKTRLIIEGVFEVFVERNRESVEQLDPNATEEDINLYLQDTWDKMSLLERSKYRGDYLQEDPQMLQLEVEDEEEEEEVDTDPDADNDDVSDLEEVEKPMRKRKPKRVETKDDVSDKEEETASVESETTDKPAKRRRTKVRRESSDREDVASSELEDKSTKKRKSKVNDKTGGTIKESSPPLILETSKRTRLYNIFKGLKSERVCQICEQPGKLIRCRGPCYSHFHLSCVKPGDSDSESSSSSNIDDNDAYREDLREIKEKLRENQLKEEEAFDDENFKCIDCLSAVAPPCFICHERDGERVKCSVLACGKHYHMNCLKGWPQSQWQGGRLTCPYHVCHTCVSDNPQNGHPRSNNEKFARCVRCPSTYHASILCLPAGSNVITGSQILCPKHYKSAYPPVNATWCFLCSKGGSLICCDACPMSFHLECLEINAPEGGFICEDCETGRLPLYGEVVWVKHGSYRWWPSLICYPQDIPTNIAIRPHKTGEFCVMFLGTRDYNWVHRGKVFLFQDGDASAKVIGTKKVEDSYRKALEEAKVYHERMTIEKNLNKYRDSESRQLKPPPYIKIKVNKPVGNVKIREGDSIVACSCDPNCENPCSPESDCLNRILLTECSPDHCPAGVKCQNQMFVQRKYPALIPYHTADRGWGLKTLESIKQGQFVIEYVGEIIDEAEYKLRLQQKKERKNENYYFLTIDNCRMIDAEPKGNLSRFMNHSCDPNCETQKWTVNGDTRIGLFALRDIAVGEELTFNYNLSSEGEQKKPCLCNAVSCSGFIGLKVAKQPTSSAQSKKIEKEKNTKRKWNSNKRELMCWNCNLKINNIDEAYKCDQKTCGKYYHPQCIAIEDGPDQTFHCPWHFCAECYKRTTIRCYYCCNAFCQNHTEGNLCLNPEFGHLVCYNHLSRLPESNDIDVGEALMDDDGEVDDEVVATDEYKIANYSDGQVDPEPVKSSSPKAGAAATTSQNDESSPRGAIVEVQASSEDELRNEAESCGDAASTSKRKQKRRSRRRRRQGRGSGSMADGNDDDEGGGDGDGGGDGPNDNVTRAEDSFTLEQIAAIIGIVK